MSHARSLVVAAVVLLAELPAVAAFDSARRGYGRPERIAAE